MKLSQLSCVKAAAHTETTKALLRNGWFWIRAVGRLHLFLHTEEFTLRLMERSYVSMVIRFQHDFYFII